MNIFEKAARGKYRFESIRGELTVEQLWDLPLKSNTGARVDLDTIAKTVNNSLKSASDDSFVETKPNKEAAILETKLEIIKFIIADKQAQIAAAEKRVLTNQRKQKLAEALARKQDAALEGMSEADILAELNKLEEAA